MTDIQEIDAHLKKLDIEVERMHSESAGGQLEIVLKYQDIIKAAENYDYTREVIANYYIRKG